MATRYVATNGNDGWPGTIGQPWLTLTYAATQLIAGDTLLIRGGTYTGAGIDVDFSVDGESGSRITIDNYLEEEVILDAADTYPADSVLSSLVDVTGDYITIRDITIHDSRGHALLLSGDYCYAYNITGIDSREAGMLSTGTGDLFDSCTMTNAGNGWGIDGQITWGPGIGTTGTNCTIQNSISHTNIGEGFKDGAGLNNIIQDNVAYNNDAVNLLIDSSTGIVARRNLIYDTSASPLTGIMIAATDAQPSHLTIENNLVMGCLVNLQTDATVTHLDSVWINNNTFVNAIGDGDTLDMGVYFRGDIATYTNSVFMCNIVIEEDEAMIPITVVDSSHAGLTFDYNCWSKAADADAQGDHDVTGDPKLAETGPTTAGNLTGAYFRLLSDSPCIDAGINVGVYDDYFKNIRPQADGYDIGASEDQPLIQLRHTTIRA